MSGSTATLGIARLLGVPPPESLPLSVELTRLESSPEEAATKVAETRERLLRAAARRTARDEARSLLSLIRPGTGETVRTVRELIEVTEAQEDALLDRILAHPEESTGILRALHFREMVLDEFNRLVNLQENAEQTTSVEVETVPLTIAGIPMPPLLHELVVPVNG